MHPLPPVARARFSITCSRRQQRSAGRRGFTLIEILVSLTITLIMMGAVVTLFGVMADSVSGSRSLIEASDRLRAARNRIQTDLQAATAVPMQPPLRPEADLGYFEIVEGQDTDGVNKFNGGTGQPVLNTLFGDCDDVLLLTVRSRGEPYLGRVDMGAGNPVMMESQVAEVVYFLKQTGTEAIIDANKNDPNSGSPPLRLFTLYRRAFLVLPSAGLTPSGTLAAYYAKNDVSVRTDASGTLFANSLGDLTKPQNRYGHVPTPTSTVPAPFPSRFDIAANGTVNVPVFTTPANATDPNRVGEDVLLTNVLAFDVQVFDPTAPIFMADTGQALEPRDAGYAAKVNGGTAVAFGAYADLGYLAKSPFPQFGQSPRPKSKLTTRPFVYDTWSLHYENDGVDASGAVGGDLGTNGLDDNGDGVVDDVNEYDTRPPYAAPLRGIRVTIRIYEPSSQQVRQVTVIQDFLPE